MGERRKFMLSIPISSCRLGANGRNICGFVYRRRNGADQYGPTGGLSETEEFSCEGSAVESGPFLERYHHHAVSSMHDIKCEIIVVVTDDGNVNIYLCFKITY